MKHCLDCLVQWLEDRPTCWWCRRPGREGALPARAARRKTGLA